MNLATLLMRAGRADAGRPALVHGTALTATYAELARRAATLAAALRERLALAPGTRVAIVMKNTPDYVTTLFGIWTAGLAAVPVNAKLHAKEIEYILDDCAAAVCFATPDLVETVAAGAGIRDGEVRLIEVGGREWRSLLAGDSLDVPAPAAPDDLAWLFYTSGTTGRPKGAMLSHRNLLAMIACTFIDVDTIAPGDAILHSAPMSHASGLYILPTVAASAVQVVPESGGFDPAEIFRLIAAHRGVHLFAAPTMVHHLIRSPPAGDADTRNLETIVYGGGPMYVADCKAAMELLGNKLAQIYGQGESPMTITALNKARHGETDHPDYEARLASAGVAQSLVEVRVAGRDGATVPFGETGEVVVRGPSVMLGYWNRPEATAETIRDGWLFTGDLGAMAADGFLTLKDRSTDLIISGGANIYPREVEEALLTHPGVAEAAVVGRPHREWGEEVVAFVVTAAGATVGAAELDAHCLENIARFKRPKEVRFVEVLPKNSYGKVTKTTLRAWLETDQGRD